MFFSCTTVDLENNATTSITNQLKNDLKLNQFSNKNISGNLVVNWEAFSTIEKEDFEIYEFEANEKKPSTIESNLFQSKLKYELVTLKKQNSIYSYLIEAYSSLNHPVYSNSIQNLKNFTGTLNVYELNGNLIGQLVVFNGTCKNTTRKNILEPLNEVINSFNLQQHKSNKIPECYEAYLVYTVAYAYTDHYSSVTVGNYTHLTYKYTTFETTTTSSYMNSPYPCGTDGDSLYIVHRTSTYRDVVDDQIINELTGKAKCLNDLLDKDGDSFVQNLLANFEGKSEFNIQIISKDKVSIIDDQGNTKEVNGHTLPPINNVIVIEISTSRINDNAALEGARVILHEYIHADIFRKLNTLYNTSGTMDFKKMSEVYENQHGTMAELYLNSMKEALKGFHKNVLTDDYNKYINYYGEAPNDAFYEALAWGGLRDNDVKAWVDLPAEKKTAIAVLANRAILLSKTVPCPN